MDHSPPAYNGIKASHYKTDPSRKVDQKTSSAVHVSTFKPTAPCSSPANASVFFHLGHTGNEAIPKMFPACISPGRGIIVREGHLHGPWACMRPTDDICHSDLRSVTFPGDPSKAIAEHDIRIVGSAVVEFSVLEATEPAHLIRLKIKTLVAAASEEFHPGGGTEGVPIWMGFGASPDSLLQPVEGTSDSWQFMCDGGEVVRI